MLTLRQALQEEEPDHWRAIALVWGFPYPATAQDIPAEIIVAMLSADRVGEQFRALPEYARDAVHLLRGAGGKIPVAVFTHRFGEIRPMGPARREREQPWIQPASVTEHLWYRGWIGRAFLRVDNVTQEYIFLPDDLAALLPAGGSALAGVPPLRSYSPGRDERIRRAGEQAADDACTLMAYLRNWPQPAARPPARWRPDLPVGRHLRTPESLPLLLSILTERGLLTGDPIQPDSEQARAFLEGDRTTAAAYLLAAWRDSETWNDLGQLLDLRIEGEWPNDPAQTRHRLLEALRAAPRGEWCTLESFLQIIRETAPEYLRPASESEAWMVRDASGAFLHGLDSWDTVEGELARAILIGPLVWLGAAETVPAESPRAFRLIGRAALLWDESAAPAVPAVWSARVRADGMILAPAETPMMFRYQLARCAQWIGRQGGAYLYRITPRSLDLARSQGVRVEHILGLLERLVGKIPPQFAKALRRWEKSGSEAVVQSGRVLVFRNGEAAKRFAPRIEAGRGIAARVDGPVWIVSASGLNKLRSLLAEDGILLEEKDDQDPRI